MASTCLGFFFSFFTNLVYIFIVNKLLFTCVPTHRIRKMRKKENLTTFHWRAAIAITIASHRVEQNFSFQYSLLWNCPGSFWPMSSVNMNTCAFHGEAHAHSMPHSLAEYQNARVLQLWSRLLREVFFLPLKFSFLWYQLMNRRTQDEVRNNSKHGSVSTLKLWNWLSYIVNTDEFLQKRKHTLSSCKFFFSMNVLTADQSWSWTMVILLEGKGWVGCCQVIGHSVLITFFL